MTATGEVPGSRLVHGVATDVGQVRGHNEDAFGIDPERGLYVVADGLGGHQAGEVASAVAVERLLGTVADGSDDDHGRRLEAAAVAAHRAVQAATAEAPGRAGMGTTIVAAWIPRPGPRMWMINVGDSRGFLIRDGVLKQLSIDHTAVEELRRAGSLPEDPALWPARQQLTQALGPSETVDPYSVEVGLEAGDRVLLCSDGLTDMVSGDSILRVVDGHPDPRAGCAALVRAANRGGGIDNITVVLVDVVTAVSNEGSRR